MKSLKTSSAAPTAARTTMHVVKPLQHTSTDPKYTAHITRFAIPTREGLRLVVLSDIQYIKAEGNYSSIHISGGERHLVSRTLKHFVDRLTQRHFVRSHQSYLVNCEHIQKLLTSESNEIMLADGTRIPVSRRLGPDLKNYLLNQYSF